LPNGEGALKALAADGHTTEFIVNQYRHNKTILALGASMKLLQRAGIGAKLGSGAADSGLLLGDDAQMADAFIGALAKHRHYERETDPPTI
jgi:catalase